MYKVFLTGVERTGKTQLLNRFCNSKQFDGTYAPSTQADFNGAKVKVDHGTSAVLQLWDYPGNPVYAPDKASYCRGVHVCVLVCDMMRKSSLDGLKQLKEEFAEANEAYRDSCEYVLLINKAEVGNKDKQAIFPEDVVEWCEETTVEHFFETSAALDTNLVTALMRIGELAFEMDKIRKAKRRKKKEEERAKAQAGAEATEAKSRSQSPNDMTAETSPDKSAQATATTTGSSTGSGTEEAGQGTGDQDKGDTGTQDKDDEEDEEDGTFLTGLNLGDEESERLQDKQDQIEALTLQAMREDRERLDREAKIRKTEKLQRLKELQEQENARAAKSDAEILQDLTERTQFSLNEIARFKNLFLYSPHMDFEDFRQFLSETKQSHWNLLADRLFVAFNVRRHMGGIGFEDFTMSLSHCIHGPPAERAALWFRALNSKAFPSRKKTTEWVPQLYGSDDDTDDRGDVTATESPLTKAHLTWALARVFEIAPLTLTLLKAGQSSTTIQERLAPHIAKAVDSLFSALQSADTKDASGVTKEEFVSACVEQPNILSIFNFRYHRKTQNNGGSRSRSPKTNFGSPRNRGRRGSMMREGAKTSRVM